MDKSCYCCDRRSAIDAAGAKENSLTNNLNVALRELEVLNVGSDKVRLPGLASSASFSAGKVMMRPNVPNAISPPKRVHGGFCVLHMNKRFVTNFVTSSSSSAAAVLGQKQCEAVPSPMAATSSSRSNFLCDRKLAFPLEDSGVVAKEAVEFGRESVAACNEPVMNSLKVRTSRTRFRFHKPYEMPWLRKLEERVRAYNWNRAKDGSWNRENRANKEETSGESNGCKSGSNPSTPSKSASNGGGLMRSRSLDNLATKRWTDVEDVVVVLESKDIENVAQKMKDLQVM